MRLTTARSTSSAIAALEPRQGRQGEARRNGAVFMPMVMTREPAIMSEGSREPRATHERRPLREGMRSSPASSRLIAASARSAPVSLRAQGTGEAAADVDAAKTEIAAQAEIAARSRPSQGRASKRRSPSRRAPRSPRPARSRCSIAMEIERSQANDAGALLPRRRRRPSPLTSGSLRAARRTASSAAATPTSPWSSSTACRSTTPPTCRAALSPSRRWASTRRERRGPARPHSTSSARAPSRAPSTRHSRRPRRP